MTCKNCGAELKDTARVCTACGAFVDDESGYTLLTADDRIDDYYSFDPYSEPPRSRSKVALMAVIMILVIALSSVGGLFFLNKVVPKLHPNPEVAMTAAGGVINEDEKVIYVTLNNNDIEKIHGVSLIDTALDSNAVISSNYEYTKNIDDTFRAIFFDTADLDLQSGKTYEYTFEIKLGFTKDESVYTYRQPIKFDGNISGDASDIVFDHSLSADSGEQTTAAQTEETTVKKADIGFIYTGYWYTLPVSSGDVNTVAALEFSKDKTVKRYTYTREGEGDWKRSDSSGSFKLSGDILTVKTGEEQLQIRVKGKTLIQLQDNREEGELAARKYNSAVNAQTFFDEDTED